MGLLETLPYELRVRIEVKETRPGEVAQGWGGTVVSTYLACARPWVPLQNQKPKGAESELQLSRLF
jgi:hypothetical protein